MSAATLLVLGAILGGVVQATIAWLDRARESRAAALVVHDTLQDALWTTSNTSLRIYREIFIDFRGYLDTWEQERKVLARRLPAAEYVTVSRAFSSLGTLAKMESSGRDLSEEVFDGLSDATRACERARRVTFRYSRSRRERAARRFDQTKTRIKDKRGQRKTAKSVRRALKDGENDQPRDDS